MLEVCKYLAEQRDSARANGLSPEASAMQALVMLNIELGIKATLHPIDPLVILNYDQIASPKKHPITLECRGLTLEMGTWRVVARAFPRFFNLGEWPEHDAELDWSDFVCQEKCDGSLMLLYHYNGNWRVNTRGSFALGEIAPGVGKTWEEVFYEAGIDEVGMDDLGESWTHVFELCSPYNKVVRRYDKPTLFLLSSFNNATGREDFSAWHNKFVADFLRVEAPATYEVRSLADIDELIEKAADPTWEGVVVRDSSGHRVKIKSPKYVALHHLRGEGDNLCHPKRLLPFVLAEHGEEAELLRYFPEVTEAFFKLRNRVSVLKYEVVRLWEAAKDEPTQKGFAMKVKEHSLSGVLFEARKTGKPIMEVFRDAERQLLHVLS